VLVLPTEHNHLHRQTVAAVTSAATAAGTATAAAAAAATATTAATAAAAAATTVTAAATAKLLQPNLSDINVVDI
jgi:hypothetical protein